MLVAEMPFDDFSVHAIGRVERLGPPELVPGTVVTARLRASTQGGVVAEPLSLVHPSAKHNCVDALHFDDVSQQGMSSALIERLKRMVPLRDSSVPAVAQVPITPNALRDFRHELQRQAERGTAPENAEQARAELIHHAERLADSRLTAFRAALGRGGSAGERLLSTNYLCLQWERLMRMGIG